MSVKFRPTPLSEKELKEQLLASQMALAELSIVQADAQLQNKIAIVGAGKKYQIFGQIGLVKTWVSLIRKGIYTTDSIPNIGNLREVVLSVLGEGDSA